MCSQQALAEPVVKERFAALGVEPVPGTRAQARDFVRSESARWGEVVRTRGVKMD